MSPEEQKLLSELFERIRANAGTARDRDAEDFIARQTREQPYAAYVLSQAVILQEKGLEAASARIHELESEVARLRERTEGAGHGGAGGFLGSAYDAPTAPAPVNTRPREGGLYGDLNRAGPALDNRGPWGQPAAGPWSPSASSGGPSFLKGALGTAAGIAGGMLLADSLRGLFGSHMGGLGLGSPFGQSAPPVEETVINNYDGDDAQSDDAAALDIDDDTGLGMDDPDESDFV